MHDVSFLNQCQGGIRRLQNGHYMLPLPRKNQSLVLPNNKLMAIKRLETIKKRFNRNVQYKADYTKFMNDLLDKGYAEPVGSYKKEESVWYIPHHGVYHPRKKKMRVVFDCSAEYKGTSLNKHLLQGPDLTNTLIGVLLRFRLESIAIMADIEAMFHQVVVDERDRNLLRFLWWPGGDCNQNPEEYRMCSHLFGATSSPGYANFALKSCALDNKDQCGGAASSFLLNHFYVDDGLISVGTVADAMDLIKSSKFMCKLGGFNLTKIVSNNAAINRKYGNPDIHKVTLNTKPKEENNYETALGIKWCLIEDKFSFELYLKGAPISRRGILSTLSAVFDPLGYICPVLLEEKRILQGLCKDRLSWDESVPKDLEKRWIKWKRELEELGYLKIGRSVKPQGFNNIVSKELHTFCDASNIGYGVASYLRLINDDGRICVSLLFAKSRVCPLKPITVPRLELGAAVLAVKTSRMLFNELQMPQIREYFYSDSKVVLGYISNDAKRFHVYVANRVQSIRSLCSPCQWKHVKTENNPADICSRGATPKSLAEQNNIFINGPRFLQRNFSDEIFDPIDTTLQSDDPEVKINAC